MYIYTTADIANALVNANVMQSTKNKETANSIKIITTTKIKSTITTKLS